MNWPFITRRTVRLSERIIRAGDAALVQAVVERRLTIDGAAQVLAAREQTRRLDPMTLRVIAAKRMPRLL